MELDFKRKLLKNIIIVLLVLGFGAKCFGQDKKVVRDSTIQYNTVKDSIAQDSLNMYKNIKNYSQRSKVTKILHKWIFRRKKHKSHNKKPQDLPDYGPYAGKIVRNIIIESKDPFGHSVIDSTTKPRNWLERAGNTIHVKSKRMAIQKFLLFKKNQQLDTLLIQETARLLRNQNYIREVRIVPRSTEHSTDSIDLVVKVLDSWSLLPKVSLSSSHSRFGLQERNFIGMGHRVNLKYSKRFSDGNTGFESVYKIPNIKNSFVDFTGKYSRDFDHFYDKFLSVQREFYSPLTRWAGGAFVQERYLERPFPKDSLAFTDQDFKYLYQDYWGGRAFTLFEGNSKEERTTNLILSLRTFFLNYKESPSIEYDSINYFSNERFYLARIGVASRQYVRDHYIFRDGETEDVPVGTVYSITSGVQRKNHQNRLYLGFRVAYGNYYNWGFLSGDFEMGSFFKGPHTEQTTISFQANYFSPLLPLGGGWKMRQFVKPQLVIGLNRLNSVADRLGLNENPYFKGVNSSEYVNYGNKHKYINYRNGSIRGFGSPANGTRKYVLDLQTQFYSPWKLLGFRLNPFLHVSLDMLADSGNSYGSNKMYSSFGLGLIIRNDYLVLDSFQLSLAYFPSMPGEGSSIIKTNSFKNDDFGFQDFRVGEPHPVIYE